MPLSSSSPTQLVLDLLALALAGGGGAALSAYFLPVAGDLSPWQRWRHTRRWRRSSAAGGGRPESVRS